MNFRHVLMYEIGPRIAIGYDIVCAFARTTDRDFKPTVYQV